MPKGDGMPANIHLRVCLGLRIHSLLRFLFHFQCRHVGRVPGTGLDALEVFLRQFLQLAGLEIPDQDQGDILR